VRGIAILLFAGTVAAQEIDRFAIEIMPGLTPEQREPLYRAVGKPAEMEKALAALEPADAARLRAMPRGELREERYNHGVLLEVEDLTAAQRDLLERAVAATDAAMRALLVQRRRIAPSLDDEMRPRMVASLDRQRYETEQRFWQVVYFVLEPAQARWARERLSPRYRPVREPEQQLYVLKGITPSQATRVRAIFAEFESERAADDAATLALRARLQDRSLAAAERQALQCEAAEASARVQRLADGLRGSIYAILTPEQVLEFEASPLVLGMGQRGQPASRVLGTLPLSPEQASRRAGMQKEFEREQAAIQKGMSGEYNSMMKEAFGPESPQQMTMETMRREVYGRVLERMREFGGRFVLEVLDAEQVARWIVDPT